MKPLIFKKDLGVWVKERGAALQRFAYQLIYSVAITVADATKVWRDWCCTFGPIQGKKGETLTIRVEPRVFFRGEKIMATDSGEKTPGYNTRIKDVRVGGRSQRPQWAAESGTLTYFFANGSLGNGIRWDDCAPWEVIEMDVYFVVDGTFDSTVFGEAVWR